MIIRKAIATDKKNVLRICERLSDFKIPSWRTCEEIASEDIKSLDSYFSCPKPNQHLFVAELESTVTGILFLEERTDFFNKGRLLHISIIAIDKDNSGEGIGSKLLEYSECFAHELDIGRISLNVFSSNKLARNIYRTKGFDEDTIFMLKDL
ncbi:GNAT family N-acetyltransferase [Vibrio harveyi]|uniref:GNAT family N-acetyltransferase n=1 Tax=Vibrio harveyi TaxID=669 RepID=UPI0038CDBA43